MPPPASFDPQPAARPSAIRFLADRIDYERTRAMPYDESRLGLDRMRQLLDRLGNPGLDLPIVHVAGTKGKGSTSDMIAAALGAAGYRTGLFTSPHLEGVEERMAIDGRPCQPGELVELIRLVRPVVEAMDRLDPGGSGPAGPTYFEITTAMALLHFARRGVQAAVLEVGLGGRLDATNVCMPRVAVITSISFDHTQQLGDTLAAIAGEKAGIVKPGVPLVSGVVQPEPREVIRLVCRQRGCPLIERGTDYEFDYEPPRHAERGGQVGRVRFRTPAGSQDFALGLLGRHQAANAATALAVLDQLRQSDWRLPEAAVGRALAGLACPARIELLARQPAVVLDAAHNVASAEALLETLAESFSATRRLLIFAATRDKDYRGMLARLLRCFDEVFFTCYLDNPRAVPPQELAACAAQLWAEKGPGPFGRHGPQRGSEGSDPRPLSSRWPIYDNPAGAWQAAIGRSRPDDLICITGSFFLAAEIRRLLHSAGPCLPPSGRV
jgi:dihydrofolate synthase/folylpolyglutamate synthase